MRGGAPGRAAGAPLPELPHAGAAPVRNTRLLRRIYLPRAGPAARDPGGNGEDPDARRADPAAGLHGSRPMRRRRPEPHTLSGAYVLDALSDSDRAQFERHLARCPACAREVAELREATTALARASSAVPPPALIQRVLKSAGQVRQLPPAIGHPATRGIGRVTRARTPRRLSPQTLPRLAGALAVIPLA